MIYNRDRYFAAILSPRAEATLTSADLTPKERWKYDRWRERYTRRFGRNPEVHGVVGDVYGIKVEDRDS